MIDIESKILSRSYTSPSRARSAVKRSHLSQADKKRMAVLIDDWETERPIDHVVAGVPVEVIEADGVHGVPDRSFVGRNGSALVPSGLALLSLDARVRVRLTVVGVAWLHEARKTVVVPSDLLERQGVWETTLWELMVVLGNKLALDGSVLGEPIERGLVEVLDSRTGS